MIPRRGQHWDHSQNSSVDTDLPRHEADGLDDGRLHNLLAGEDAPCDGVRALRVSVCAQVAALVDDVVRDCGIALDVR